MLYFTLKVFCLANQNRRHIHVMLEYAVMSAYKLRICNIFILKQNRFLPVMFNPKITSYKTKQLTNIKSRDNF